MKITSKIRFLIILATLTRDKGQVIILNIKNVSATDLPFIDTSDLTVVINSKELDF